MISIPTEIQITQSIVYFIAAAIPIYLTRILKKRTDGNNNNNNNNKHFKVLTIILAGFVLMQAIYHTIGALGFSLLAKGILEPLSFVILLFFGVIYLVSKIRTKSEEEVKVQ
ncbi:MAG: hypothetical protein WBZ20_03530 [Nitrososphaeraceae archaeon]